jgi:hypothetical protein
MKKVFIFTLQCLIWSCLQSQNITINDIVDVLKSFQKEEAGAALTRGDKDIFTGKYTGKSSVYFHPNRSFTSSKRLFYAMGHEFVHVSQFAALAGQSSLIVTKQFISMMDYWAYGYNSYMGQEFMTPMFSRSEIQGFMASFPDYFDKLNWNNFSWTYNFKFANPF